MILHFVNFGLFFEVRADFFNIRGAAVRGIKWKVKPTDDHYIEGWAVCENEVIVTRYEDDMKAERAASLLKIDNPQAKISIYDRRLGEHTEILLEK